MHAGLVWLGALLTSAAPAAPLAPDTLVVGPRQFLEAFQPWIAYRTQQGHRLGFVSNEYSAEEIRVAIRESAKSGQLRSIVILGDADPAAGRDPAVRARCTPTQYVRAKVNIKLGSEPEIATDNWYADLNGDDSPDLAIGRITADSADELRLIVRKIIDYEQSTDFGLWRQRINFVAGIGGFGALADAVLEGATKKFVTDGIPTGYSTTVTYGSWQSPYCPDPRFFHEASLRRLNEGCLFWVYIGHGQTTELDRVRVPGQTFPILSTKDMAKVSSESGSPIAVFLACYTGAFDQPRDCLAEELLRAPRGPVAVLGGSRITMPYAMAILGTNLLDECFQQQSDTLGAMLLQAKRGLIRPDESFNRKMIDSFAAMLSPLKTDLGEERIEHLHLFNLIGDPLLRIRRPLPVQLSKLGEVHAGDRIVISGDSPLAGRCTLELVCRRDQLRFEPPERVEFDRSDAALAGYSETYDRSNIHQWSTRDLDINTGTFETEIIVPLDAHGACHVRAYVAGMRQHALGTADVFVKPAATALSTRKQRN